MAVKLVAEKAVSVGEPTTLEGPSPSSSFGVVFEDNGETGYLYSLDFAHQGNPILDAMHIYNVAQVADRDKPSLVNWSGRGTA